MGILKLKISQLLFITLSLFAFQIPGCKRNIFIAEITLVFSDSPRVNSDRVNIYRTFKKRKTGLGKKKGILNLVEINLIEY